MTMGLLALDASAFAQYSRLSSYTNRSNDVSYKWRSSTNFTILSETGVHSLKRKQASTQFQNRQLKYFYPRKTARCFSQAKDAAASSVEELGSKTLEEHEIRDALTTFSDVWSSADVDCLKTLPKGSQVEVGDAGFALSSGAVTRECGEEAGEALRALGSSLEQGQASGAANAVSLLTSAALRLPPGSAARAGVGRRLRKAAGLLGGVPELNTMADSCSRAGLALGSGCAPDAEEPAPAQGRILKFGSMQVAVTGGGVFTGAGVAAAFSALSWYFATNFASIEDNSSRYSNSAAGEVSQSLKGALTVFGFSCFALAALSTFGLLALGIQITSSNEVES